MAELDMSKIRSPLHEFESDGRNGIPTRAIEYYRCFYDAYPPARDASFVKWGIFFTNKFFYISFGVSVFTFLIFEFFDRQLVSWILFNLILTIKCVAVATILFQMNERILTRGGDVAYLGLCERAVSASLTYYRVVVILGAIVYVVWCVVRYNAWYIAWYILFCTSIVGGTYGFVSHLATVMLFCIAETYEVQDKISALQKMADEQSLVKKEYVEVLDLLSVKQKGIYRINELILGSVLVNMGVLLVILVSYQNTTGDFNYFYSIWYVVYVSATLFLSDIAYLFVVLPMMSKCNDMMRVLISDLSLANWEGGRDSDRRDVLLAALGRPIRVKFFGIDMTKDEMRRRLVGLAIALISIMAKYLQQEINAA